ncbi:hypothetical protein SAMN05444004_12536 [Jannaschia faecimaris]|uniref:Uncharacterized protein n=1 Tax=Jannaschia faecimaris TaxID=1244108 RepID=A0A1H3U882_9RHOB|nr:hypothetical protein [Jannaschia faecimaris]SDZ58588.1 hypothetical protein SAMN05444004_12536 [Jannaschia faecimaris]
MKHKRLWGLFSIAVFMVLMHLILYGVIRDLFGGGQTTMFPAAMWTMVAYHAFRGNPAFIEGLGFGMAAIQAALAVFVHNSASQLSIQPGFSPEELLLNALITVPLWLGVALRARYLKMSLPSSAASGEDAKQKDDPAYKYIPLNQRMEMPQHEEPAKKVIPAAVDRSQDARISSRQVSNANATAPKASEREATVGANPGDHVEAQPSQSDRPIARADQTENADEVPTKEVEAVSDQPTKDDEINLGGFPKAQMATKYRPDVLEAWTKAQALPVRFQRRFLESLERDPRSDAQKTGVSLEEDFKKEQRPYDDEAANDALEEVRTISRSAELEFQKVYETLGDAVPLSEIIGRIEETYGLTARTIAFEAQRKLEEQERQRALEAERQRKLEAERQRKLEEERQRKLEEQRQRRLEEEQQRWLEEEPQRALEAERQRKLKEQRPQKLKDKELQRRLEVQRQLKQERIFVAVGLVIMVLLIGLMQAN